MKNGCQKRKVPKKQEKPKHAQFLAAYPKPLKFAPCYTDFQGKTFYKLLDMLIAHQKKKDVNTTLFFSINRHEDIERTFKSSNHFHKLWEMFWETY